jgi:hypothetical protein
VTDRDLFLYRVATRPASSQYEQEGNFIRLFNLARKPTASKSDDR